MKRTLRLTTAVLGTLTAALSGCGGGDPGNASAGAGQTGASSQAQIAAIGVPAISGCNVSQAYSITSPQVIDFVAAQTQFANNLQMQLYNVDDFGQMTQVQQQAQAVSSSLSQVLNNATMANAASQQGATAFADNAFHGASATTASHDRAASANQTQQVSNVSNDTATANHVDQTTASASAQNAAQMASQNAAAQSANAAATDNTAVSNAATAANNSTAANDSAAAQHAATANTTVANNAAAAQQHQSAANDTAAAQNAAQSSTGAAANSTGANNTGSVSGTTFGTPLFWSPLLSSSQAAFNSGNAGSAQQASQSAAASNNTAASNRSVANQAAAAQNAMGATSTNVAQQDQAAHNASSATNNAAAAQQMAASHNTAASNDTAATATSAASAANSAAQASTLANHSADTVAAHHDNATALFQSIDNSDAVTDTTTTVSDVASHAANGQTAFAANTAANAQNYNQSQAAQNFSNSQAFTNLAALNSHHMILQVQYVANSSATQQQAQQSLVSLFQGANNSVFANTLFSPVIPAGVCL